MTSLNLNPKKFLKAFLTNYHTNVKICHALWRSPEGWQLTREILNEIGKKVVENGHKGSFITVSFPCTVLDQ
ncbi:hypothetical protein PtA15_16A100 [Puccinia triticina]|uniref:Uncharacterized protein n=1 Tax=Puccinia triticina TaxID=208348 RepID=A0ABY7D3K5_9BASI|nr:uncharacterized protein PtA15_16A100 [Puccinia triticina]WAQ92194.1 hypothetical protein PtA15_16A100 [Puccinia triticina]